MKKLISIFLIAVLSVTLISCTAKEKNPEAPNGNQSGVSDTGNNENDEIISVTVDIFYPETETGDLSDDQKAAGFISKTINGGQAIYTIKKSDFDKYLNALDESVKKLLETDLLNDSEFPGITEIEYNDELTDIVIHVDSNTFEATNAFALKVSISLVASGYRQWHGIEREGAVTIVDENGNEL